jgi:hypothetical protein
MNPYLQKMTVAQLQDLFIDTTKEFIWALELQASFVKLKHLRDQIKSISEVIESKKARRDPIMTGKPSDGEEDYSSAAKAS